MKIEKVELEEAQMPIKTLAVGTIVEIDKDFYMLLSFEQGLKALEHDMPSPYVYGVHLSYGRITHFLADRKDYILVRPVGGVLKVEVVK